MSHSVRSHLRLEIDAYDETIRQFIPAYDEMLREAAAEVARVRPKRVLDLGSGTGGLAQALLQHAEVGEVVLLDVDPEMLDQARIRLTASNRAEFVLASFDDPLPRCDAAMASLSLHHITTLAKKQELYRRIFNTLPAGGVFVNADAVMPSDEQSRNLIYREWADHMVASGIEEKRAWEHFEEWSEEDTYFSLEAELGSMRSAGFEASCNWHHASQAVMVGRKGIDQD